MQLRSLLPLFVVLAPAGASAQPLEPERRVEAELEVLRGDVRAHLRVEASSEREDDTLTLRLRVPGPRRGVPFEERFGLALAGSLIGSAIGAGIGLVATVSGVDAIRWGLLGGALFGSPIGACAGAATGTTSDWGSAFGAMTGLPASWSLGGFVGIASLGAGSPPEAALAVAWLMSTLTSSLIAAAWTGLDEAWLRSLRRRKGPRVSISPLGLRGAF